MALKGSRNALLPSLNFFASAQGSALAGQVNTLPLPGASAGTSRNVDPSFLGGYGATLSQIFRGKFPDYSVGLELDVPLRNRTARADLAHDRLILRQSEVRLRQLQKRIREQVEAAWIAVKQARVSYQAARQTRILEERALEDERQQFEVGVATSYDVILSQRDLAQARSNEVVTESDYVKARTALDRAAGTTLRNNYVILDEAYHGQVSRPPSALPADEK
jgi:outer membrane protein TolC